MANRKVMKKMAGQSTLELTVALILVSMLMLASVKIFLWFSERMVLRQELYEVNRVAAGNMEQDDSAKLSDADLLDRDKTKGYAIDESTLPPLNIFN